MEDIKVTHAIQTSQEVGDLLEQLQPLVDNVDRARQYYAKKSKWPKLAFRASGISVILLSLSIPFFASLQFTWKDVLLSALAVSIAIVTSLNSFFKWEHTWRVYRQTEFLLGNLVSLYELRIVEAKQELEHTNEKNKIITAAQQLFDEANKIINAETEQFFSRVEWPKDENK